MWGVDEPVRRMEELVHIGADVKLHGMQGLECCNGWQHLIKEGALVYRGN